MAEREVDKYILTEAVFPKIDKSVFRDINYDRLGIHTNVSPLDDPAVPRQPSLLPLNEDSSSIDAQVVMVAPVKFDRNVNLRKGEDPRKEGSLVIVHALDVEGETSILAMVAPAELMAQLTKKK